MDSAPTVLLALPREFGASSGAAAGPARMLHDDDEPQASFDAVYDAHFEFVWRAMRRLGVAAASLDDAVQDAFVVVHRRLGEFEGRSSMRTWLYGIALRVARDYRRAVRRKGGALVDPLTDAVQDAAPDPHEVAARAEGMRALEQLLDRLDDDKREVFVLAELEGMTAPEMADALGVNLNTVYSRLRAARRDFEEAVARYRRRHA